jgi:hypothetical protein
MNVNFCLLIIGYTLSCVSKELFVASEKESESVFTFRFLVFVIYALYMLCFVVMSGKETHSVLYEISW